MVKKILIGLPIVICVVCIIVFSSMKKNEQYFLEKFNKEYSDNRIMSLFDSEGKWYNDYFYEDITIDTRVISQISEWEDEKYVNKIKIEVKTSSENVVLEKINNNLNIIPY